MRNRLPTAAALLAAALASSACGGPADAGNLFHGTVEVQEVRVGSKVGGRVAETLAAEGSLLKAGDPIARFEVPEIEARRAEAEAQVRIADAELERARNGTRPEEKAAARAAVESARARLALLRAGSRKEEIAAAEADLRAAAADLEFAEKEFTRQEALVADKVSTRTELDAARSARDQARGRDGTARARLDLLRAGSRVEEIDQAEAEVRRREAEEALLLAGTRAEDVAAAEGRAAWARARLREVDAALAEAEVRSPGDAVLEVLSVRKGDVLAPNAPVARLHLAGDLWVKVFVPETEIGRVSLGQAVEVSVDSFPGRKFAGTVFHVASQAEFTPRNVQSAEERRHQVFAVRVRVAEPGGVFKSGMAADVVLSGGPVGDAAR